MSELKNLVSEIRAKAFESMEDIADVICDNMKQTLSDKGHVDTGALIDSIRSTTTMDGSVITTYIYADAKSPEGVMYEEFIEKGSGIHRPGGRTTPWRYQDRNGNWHTTSGMKADPFIEPSVENALPYIHDILKEHIYSIEKYGARRAAK